MTEEGSKSRVTGEPWFTRRRSGRGLVPNTWQAWTSIVIFVVLVLSFASSLKRNVAGGVIGIVFAVVGLAAVIITSRERADTPWS
jgi:hypothetical protein